MNGTRSPKNRGLDDLAMTGRGVIARSDEAWSNSGEGDSGIMGDADIDDELERAATGDANVDDELERA